VFSGSGTNNSDRLKFRIDSCEQTLSFNSPISATTSSLTDYVFMGVSYSNAVSGVEQYYYNGFIFDVLVYSRALTVSELTVVENYLSGKWSINVGCPTPTPTPTSTITPTPSATPPQQNLLVDNLGNNIITNDGDYLLMSTGPLPTPTPTPTNTPTSTITPTPSITVTPTNTITPTNSVTPTPSITPTNTITPTITVTPSSSTYVPSSRILYYDFNDTSSYSGSSIVFDLEGNSDGTVYNSPSFNDCYQSIQFNGTNGYVTTDIDLNSQLSPANTSTVISLFTWFYPTGDGVIVSEQGSVTPPDSGWYDSQIQIVSGNAYFSVWPYAIGSTASPVIQSSISTPLNQWHYLGLTYDGTTLRAYVNGSPAGSVATARQTPYNNGSTQLHYALAYGTQTNFTSGQPYGVGRMGTFEVYNTALSQTQITNLYNNTSSQWVCPTPTPTNTPTSTVTPTPSITVTPTNTITPSITPSVTSSPVPTTGYGYNLVSTPYQIPTSGNTIISNGNGGVASGSTNPNSFNDGPQMDGIYWNAIDKDGVDRDSYYSSFVGNCVRLTISQNGSTAIYDGTLEDVGGAGLPYGGWTGGTEGTGYYFRGDGNNQIQLVQSASTQWVIGDIVYISVETITCPSITPTPTVTTTVTPSISTSSTPTITPTSTITSTPSVTKTVTPSITTSVTPTPTTSAAALLSCYVAGPLTADTSNGAVFDRSINVSGMLEVIAGAVGGQAAVPDEFSKKVARSFQLIMDPSATGITLSYQNNLVATLRGDEGTIHEGLPTAQRIGYGSGDDYDPNWLTDEGISGYTGYQEFLDTHAVNDMVWYQSGSTSGDTVISEVFEHIFHTVHLFGIMGAVPGSSTAVNWMAEENPNWQTTDLHLSMKQAIDNGMYDPSGYAPDWSGDTGQAQVAYKEYMYLLNFGMWEMSEFWDGGSLSPEWNDNMRTPSGIQTNNILGYNLFNSYFAPVLTKPSFVTLRNIFQNNGGGVSGYFADDCITPTPTPTPSVTTTVTPSISVSPTPSSSVVSSSVWQLRRIIDPSVNCNIDTSIIYRAYNTLSAVSSEYIKDTDGFCYLVVNESPGTVNITMSAGPYNVCSSCLT